MTINNPAYKTWLDSVVNPYESITVLEKSEVSDVDLSDISEALEEYVRLFKAEIASPAEILTLSRAYPTEEKYSLAVIDKELDQNEPVVIGGPASVEVVDREGHLITLAAMKRAFERFMANFRTRNAMVLHSDVQVGWALPAYISKTGKIYKSGVTGDHLFFITELRDDTKIAKKVLEQIDTGKMKSYSIAGSATSVEAVQKSSGMVMQVNDMELAEVTICEQGVNQKAKFELMKSDADRPTSSCVDGSCLIKSQSHVHSKTELFVNDDGIIDTVGSFSNWVQKAGLYENIHARRKSGKRMRSEGDPKAPTDADFRDAARVKKGVGMTMQKSPLEQLDDHLEKSIYDDPEDRPTPEAEAAKRKMIREANERDAGTKSVGKFAGGRFEAEDDFQRMKGKEILEMQKTSLEQLVENMQKSHLEGCGCASCMQRTGDDDTARPATDRNGRPTLGHMGHGNVVAILVSRMQRKAGRTKKQQDKGLGERVKDTGLGGDYAPTAQTAADFAVDRAMRSPEGGPASKKAFTSITQAGKHGQHQPTAAARHGARAAIAEDYIPPMQRHYQREGSKVGRRATEMGRENTHPYDKKAMQKGVGDVARKVGGGIRRAGSAALDAANYDLSRIGSKESGISREKNQYFWNKPSRRKILGGEGGEGQTKPKVENMQKAAKAKRKQGGTYPVLFQPKGAMQKAVYEYINKSKGNPGPGKKGRAAYKDQQQKLYDRIPPATSLQHVGQGGLNLDHEAAKREAGAHPPEEYGKRYGESMKRIKRSQIKEGAEKPQKTGVSKDPYGLNLAQKAVYEYINKNNIEKGALGAIGKVVGGAAKGAAKVGAKVAGAGVAAGEALLVPGESGKSLIGNITRVGEGAAGESKSNTPRMPGMELNMEKQAPEWTTPQTETPLHKFIENNKKDQD